MLLQAMKHFARRVDRLEYPLGQQGRLEEGVLSALVNHDSRARVGVLANLTAASPVQSDFRSSPNLISKAPQIGFRRQKP